MTSVKAARRSAKGREINRGAMVLRQWRTLELIRRFKWGISAREISRRLEVPYRTVLRDLDVLAEVFPLYSERVLPPAGRGFRYVWKTNESDLLKGLK